MTDSLARDIHGDQLYKGDVRCSIKTLRLKNIQDVSEYSDKININSKIVGYVVSTNDLSYNSADDVIK